MFDAHRHDEFSTFDGFGKSSELAEIAAGLGHSSLGITNHGNTNGLVKHYFSCKQSGIKPVMGVEGYFIPKLIPQHRGYHLCLFAKNKVGYENINTIQFKGDKQKFYNPIWDFSIIEEHSEGVICTSACIAGYLSQCIALNKMKQAERFLSKMKGIYGEDFYIEIQPYSLSTKGLQENVNKESLRLAKKFGFKCILTSDSHFGKKDDFDTYLKMHEIAGHDDYNITETYGERYIPTKEELINRYCDLQDKNVFDAVKLIDNLEDMENKIDGDIIESLSIKIPKFDPSRDSRKLLKQLAMDGLKKRNVQSQDYVVRVNEELDVISHHGFEDYFLIVHDYASWAKRNGIVVGPGRGSGCNCLVNYSLGITDVDPILFDLDFTRFLRKDKNKLPDIDVDFETIRRPEVIKYITEKYPENTAQICSYGLYKIDNLINDLAKVCGVDDKDEIKKMKSFIGGYENDGALDIELIKKTREALRWNLEFDNIIKHFSKLYNKVRYIGTHAAGVVITSEDVCKYTSVKIETKTGKKFTGYDLHDLEKIKAVKLDILGLTTLSCIDELRRLTNTKHFNEKLVFDKKILKEFQKGNCDGIFQFEKQTVQNMLRDIKVDCFSDIVAASAMNRPGPLSLGIPDQYATNKHDKKTYIHKPYHRCLESTHGCIIYQEQVQAIAVRFGGLNWDEADKLLKMQRGSTSGSQLNREENYEGYRNIFIRNATRNGLDVDEAAELFDRFFNYAFNKGHATGYSLLSVEEMFYKINYPIEFWFAKIKFVGKDESKMARYKIKAVKDGAIIFIPHVNYTSKTSLRSIEGDNVIQEGISSIKGIGEKASDIIELERLKHGYFRSVEDFQVRTKSRAVTSKVIKLLKEHGALEFNKNIYMNRVKKYNSALYARGLND